MILANYQRTSVAISNIFEVKQNKIFQAQKAAILFTSNLSLLQEERINRIQVLKNQTEGYVSSLICAYEPKPKKNIRIQLLELNQYTSVFLMAIMALNSIAYLYTYFIAHQ